LAQAAAVTHETFQSLQGAWDAALAHCAFDNLFLTLRWQRLWWEAAEAPGELLLLSFQKDGELVGVAPLWARGDALSFLGDSDLFDYHDFIVLRGKEAPFYQSLGDYLETAPWRTVTLSSLAQGSATLEHLPPLAAAHGWQWEVAQEDVAPGVALPKTWEEYLRGLAKKDRHELRRKFRRLEARAPDRQFTYFSPTASDRTLDEFLQLMRQSREEKGRFLTPQREGFFRRMASELAQAGLLGLGFLEVEKKRVAGVLYFDYQGQRLLYNSGFDPAYSHLSVGLLLKAHCLQEALEKGMRYFDFLRGDEPYKYDLGAKNRILYRLTLTR
jgi:CelD/BcsL family acetyltransferase involved in cellulose biosynthesis